MMLLVEEIGRKTTVFLVENKLPITQRNKNGSMIKLCVSNRFEVAKPDAVLRNFSARHNFELQAAKLYETLVSLMFT